MESLLMCRICLVKNVRTHIVTNRNLHELYEKLTDIPFVTKDNRPILACSFCCTKLKQCYRFWRKCLEAEELFALMMNEDYEPDPLINKNHLEDISGFIKSPIVHISIGDECQTKSIAIEEELPAVCDDMIMEPEEEHQIEELYLESLDNSCLDVADTPPHHSESDVEDIIDFVETEVEEEQEVSRKQRGTRGTNRASVAKKTKLDTRRTELEDAITPQQTKTKLDTRRTELEDAITPQQTKTDKSDLKLIPTTQKHPKENWRMGRKGRLKLSAHRKKFKRTSKGRFSNKGNIPPALDTSQPSTLEPIEQNICETEVHKEIPAQLQNVPGVNEQISSDSPHVLTTPQSSPQESFKQIVVQAQVHETTSSRWKNILVENDSCVQTGSGVIPTQTDCSLSCNDYEQSQRLTRSIESVVDLARYAPILYVSHQY